MREAIITDWAEKTGLWGRQPLRLAHDLHESPLFTPEALGELIDRYPRDHCNLVETGAPGQRRRPREGDIGGVPGLDVLQAIAHGRMCLHLRDVQGVDARYRALLDAVCDELARRVPGFAPTTRRCRILISSPSAQLSYRADLPGQHLWQLAGRTRAYVYPPSPPFVTDEQLEEIALYDAEVDLPYAPWYDDHAEAIDLTPGQMLAWPLNAPHRFEAVEGLNVAMLVSYTDEHIRRRQIVHLANGLIRHRLGRPARSRATAGPSYYAKAVLGRALRNSRWMPRDRRERRTVEFHLDHARPRDGVDLLDAAE